MAQRPLSSPSGLKPSFVRSFVACRRASPSASRCPAPQPAVRCGPGLCNRGRGGAGTNARRRHSAGGEGSEARAFASPASASAAHQTGAALERRRAYDGAEIVSVSTAAGVSRLGPGPGATSPQLSAASAVAPHLSPKVSRADPVDLVRSAADGFLVGACLRLRLRISHSHSNSPSPSNSLLAHVPTCACIGLYFIILSITVFARLQYMWQT